MNSQPLRQQDSHMHAGLSRWGGVRKTWMWGWACLAGLVISSYASEKPTAAPRTHADRPPNIVLILVDDLGWADVGCYGSRYHETPHIDALCRQGMKFTQGYAACAVCSPTRASILTGRYPARIGVTDWIHYGRLEHEAEAQGKPLEG